MLLQLVWHVVGRSVISPLALGGHFLSEEQGKNMRKLVWTGTAVVVLGAAAVYLAADYAAHHPDSWFGRCTAAAGYLGSKCNPLAGLSAAVAHSTPSGEAVEVCAAVQVRKPDNVPDAPDGEVNEPIKIEPQPGFVMPLDPADFPQTVPASEETAEPGFGPGEESEPPSGFAAPAHEDEASTPSAMPYVEDDAPVCKKCGTCPQDCCDKGPCAKDCAQGNCAKTSGTTDCGKGCCEKTTGVQETHTGCVIFGIGINSDGGLIGSVVCKPCCANGCCVQGCCNWIMSWFGLEGCGQCCESKPGVKQPVSADSDAPADDKPAEDKSKNDDVPNCQEDPSYSHQYPSCPYTGNPSGSCPYCPSYHLPAMTAPEDSPLDEVVPPKKKVKKTASNSLMHLMPQSYESFLDPFSLGARGSGIAAALRAVKIIDGEDGEVHPEVDTMEARPTDVDKIPSSDEPF